MTDVLLPLRARERAMIGYRLYRRLVGAATAGTTGIYSVFANRGRWHKPWAGSESGLDEQLMQRYVQKGAKATVGGAEETELREQRGP